MTSRAESDVERAIAAAMLVVFWLAFAALAIGLALWLALPSRQAGAICLNAGLLGLLLNPLLRHGATLATALRCRDWLLLLATLAVLAILGALTLRDAAFQPVHRTAWPESQGLRGGCARRQMLWLCS